MARYLKYIGCILRAEKQVALMRYLCTVLAIIIISTSVAWACGCVEFPLSERFDRADIVFVGTVTSVEVQSKYIRPNQVKDPPIKVVLEVTKYFKTPDQTKTVTVHTNYRNLNCSGYPFEVGGAYLVYGYERQFSTHEHWSIFNFPSGTYGVGGACDGTKDAKSIKGTKEIAILKGYK